MNRVVLKCLEFQIGTWTKYQKPNCQDDGVLIQNIVHCPLAKIPTPLDCDDIHPHLDETVAGWYYFEKPGENFDEACSDGIDNDKDNE